MLRSVEGEHFVRSKEVVRFSEDLLSEDLLSEVPL